MSGPLDGIRVLDFTEIIAGPMGAMLLSDMGADVIKVEPLGGEPWRQQSQIAPLESRMYLSLNRGKKSLPLDLTRPEAREIVYRLVPEIDVVVINYRPDVPYKLGIDYETLSAINPRLVYVENTAYGRRGPHSMRPGYDIIIQALSGLMSGDGKIQNGVPQQVSATAVADTSTGLAIAWGACAALFARERTGKGQKIEAALLSTALAVQTMRFVQVEGADQENRERFLEEINALRMAGAPYEEIYSRYEALRFRLPGNIYYRTYKTRDGVIATACLSDRLRKRMADALGLYDMRFEEGVDLLGEEYTRFAGELTQKAEGLFLTRSTDEWIDILDSVGVPCGPVLFTEELTHHEQVVANDMVVDLQHPTVGNVRMFGPVLRMTETPLKAQSASPALGQHSEAILVSLGYSAEEVRRLKDEGVTS